MAHSAYHGSQVSNMLRQLCLVPPATDVLVFLDAKTNPPGERTRRIGSTLGKAPKPDRQRLWPTGRLPPAGARLFVRRESRSNQSKIAEALLVASGKKLSLVDCASFQTMREHAAQTAFCFDAKFREQGFEILP